MTPTQPTLRRAWYLVLFAGSLPFLRLALATWQTVAGSGRGLGENPIEHLTHTTGAWALYLLLATLAITPLRRLLHAGWLLRFRRLLGLLAFFYACLHLLVWLADRSVFDAPPGWTRVAADLAKRPHITVGFLAFVLLLPLAITSTHGMIRRLGRRWGKLHRLVYGCAVLAVLHFTWGVKADLRRPIICAAILLVLIALRLPFWARDLRRDLSPDPDDKPPPAHG